MAKRANGEGNIYQRANGTWEARFSYLDPDTGVRRRVSFYGPSAKAVRDKLKTARERLDAGAPVKDATRTVGDWLAHWRATTLAASDRKESTRVLYANLCRKHLESAPFGAIPLDRLRPTNIEALVLSMRAKSLSDSTIRQTYTVLRAGLDGAVRDGLLARNPAALVARPGVPRTEARHLSASDVAAVLRAAQSSRYHAALVLIAATGLRRGECLGLSWDRVDLDAGTLKVAATLARVNGRLTITEPKTDRARRTIPLSPAVVAMLQEAQGRPGRREAQGRQPVAGLRAGVHHRAGCPGGPAQPAPGDRGGRQGRWRRGRRHPHPAALGSGPLA